jgi:hypothetical protein
MIARRALTAKPVASTELVELVQLTSGLTPCWSAPLKFHERKSELLMRLRRLARLVRALEGQLNEAGR